MKFLRAFLAAFLGQQAVACPSLLGTWQSSKEQSMEYNKGFGRATEPQIELFEQIIGVLKLTYTDTLIHYHAAKSIMVTVNGKQSDFFSRT
ncbi:MAG: hypothetical protein JWM78_1214 [Verrucomicrobiaceae bacterium]|nr:hypothetical protein [Verrucomicrobiaceae bacterium]